MQTKEGKTVLDQPFTLHVFNKVEIPESNGKEPPVYCAADNTPLDRFYQKIPTSFTPSDEIQTDIYTHETTYKEFHKDENIDLKMPLPTSFESKEEYSKALEEWYKKCINYVSSVMLPIPLSGQFYLPEPPKTFTKDAIHNPGFFRTFKPNVWPLMPENYVHMINLVNSDEPISPDTEFPNQIPKRDIIYMKHHITESNQWMSQLIPPEPIPILYDTFEDYSLAYSNWSHLVSSSLSIPIPSPIGMGNIASIDPINEDDKDFPSTEHHSTISTTQANPHEFTTPGLISGIPLQNEDTLSSELHNILTLTENGPEEFSPHSLHSFDNAIIFGGDAFSFLRSQIEYGVEDITSQTSHQSIHALFVSSSQTISQQKLETLDDVNSLLSNEFSPADIQTYLSITSNSSALSTILTDPTSLSTFLNHTLLSPTISIRASLLLQTLLLSDPSCPLSSKILESDSLQLLDSYVSILSLTRIPFTDLLTPLSSSTLEDPLLRSINRMYLLSKLIRIYQALHLINSPFYSKLLEAARVQSHTIARQLIENGKEKAGQLCDIAGAPRGSDKRRALQMLLESDSPQLQRLVLGPEFVYWLNSLSSEENGPVFIEYLTNSAILEQAGVLFMRNPTGTLGPVDTLSEPTIRFVSELLYFMKSFLEQHHMRCSGRALVDCLARVLAGKNAALHKLFLPLTMLIMGPKEAPFSLIFENPNDGEFKRACADALNKLCDTVKAQENNVQLSLSVMRSAVEFGRDTDFCSVIANNFDLVIKISGWLFCENRQLMALSWKLLKAFSEYPKILQFLFSMDCIMDAFGKNPKENSLNKSKELTKMLKFAIRIVSIEPGKRADDKIETIREIKRMLCEAMEPGIGPLVCIYKNMHITLGNQMHAQMAINEWIHLIKHSKDPELAQYKEKLNLHTDENDERRKTRPSLKPKTHLKQ